MYAKNSIFCPKKKPVFGVHSLYVNKPICMYAKNDNFSLPKKPHYFYVNKAHFPPPTTQCLDGTKVGLDCLSRQISKVPPCRYHYIEAQGYICINYLRHILQYIFTGLNYGWYVCARQRRKHLDYGTSCD